jgi:hypothetical protein
VSERTVTLVAINAVVLTFVQALRLGCGADVADRPAGTAATQKITVRLKPDATCWPGLV